MPIEIDPLNPKENAELMNLLLKNADNSSYKKLRKAETKKNKKRFETVDGKEIALAHGLKKSKKGGWWVIGPKLGTGSKLTNTAVKSLPCYYEMDENKKYQCKPAQPESVIKIMKPSNAMKWQRLKLLAHHEYEQLKIKDQNLELFWGENKIYLISTKVKGVSLDKYLYENNNLSLKERLHLIFLIIEAVKSLCNNNIYHLDLKLENIFYDKKTGTITFVDFGSSLNFDGEYIWFVDFKFDENNKIQKEIKKIRSLAEIENLDFYVTTPFLRPCDQEKNTLEQIVSYVLAGVFACILCDLRKILKWDEFPIFDKKNNLGTTGVIISNDRENRAYEFDKILISSNLSKEEKENLKSITDGLKVLGSEYERVRGDLDDFLFSLKPVLSKLGVEIQAIKVEVKEGKEEKKQLNTSTFFASSITELKEPKLLTKDSKTSSEQELPQTTELKQIQNLRQALARRGTF